MIRFLLATLLLGFTFATRGAWADDSAGFESSLFDGQTLAGWTVENGAKAAVEDGLLVLKDGDGWLRTDFEYTDFNLHIEWKALKENAYDGGIFIRTPIGGAPYPTGGYQINLLDGKEGNIPNIPAASSTGLVKKGEWNVFDITVVGDTVSLRINGKDAWKVAGLKNPTGYVGLQCEVPLGGQFQFRNMKLTELKSVSLFNGRDLTGWETAKVGDTCWQVVDGLLVCTGEKGDWLRSHSQYGDFDVRLEYRVSAEGNSGVYIRVPHDGNHHRENDTLPPAGYEVQVLDDTAPKHKTLKDYQYSASLYDVVGAKPRCSRPVGEWNSLGIRCQKDRVIIHHNGQKVVDVNSEQAPLMKLRQTSGFLGLQNHSTRVEFRSLRVQALE